MSLARVCLVGQPYWTAKLCDGLRRYAADRLEATTLTLPREGWTAVRARWKEADLVVRVGFRPGARTLRGLAFDSLWALLRATHPRPRCAYYWIGTDVMNAGENATRGGHTPFFRLSLRDRHLAGAPWLTEELRRIGVPADTAIFPESVPQVEEVAPMPETFQVLTYVPDARYKFYGGEFIYRAARELPGVIFSVMGGKGAWVCEPLPNLRFHGWLKDTGSAYSRASVLLRLLPHDAIGATVKEGLVHARHVIYTYPLPCTTVIKYGDYPSLLQSLRHYHQQHLAGTLRPNEKGREYALRMWEPSHLVYLLAEALVGGLQKTKGTYR